MPKVALRIVLIGLAFGLQGLSTPVEAQGYP